MNLKTLKELTRNEIRSMKREEIKDYLSEYLLDDDFEFSDAGLALRIRTELYDRGFGSEDRIFSPRFGGEPKEQMYQIWFERWDVEGERTDKVTYGISCSSGLRNEENLNYRVAKLALWVLVGYTSLKNKFDHDTMDTWDQMKIKNDNSGII